MRIAETNSGKPARTTRSPGGRHSLRYHLTGQADGTRTVRTDTEGTECVLPARELGRIRRDVDRGYRNWVARRRALGYEVPFSEPELEFGRGHPD